MKKAFGALKQQLQFKRDMERKGVIAEEHSELQIMLKYFGKLKVQKTIIDQIMSQKY